MTEYWKSQAKKFCDVCKCWITDNKVSVQFHENGKRHQENVTKKINQLVKKSTKERKEMAKLDGDLKKMEEEALEAYMRDIEQNPDYSSQAIKERLKTLEQDTAEGEDSKLLAAKLKQKPLPDKPEKKLWYEAKSDQGHTYYWNTMTNASVWEPPEEGFVSLDEQKKIEERQKKLEEEAEKEKSAELKAAAERLKMREKYKAKVEAEKEEAEKARQEQFGVATEPASIGPAPRANPYGAWTVVEPPVHRVVDLQLPSGNEEVKRPAPQVVQPKPKIQIKEKTLDPTKLDFQGEPTVFKKRKFTHRGNTRQRFEDD